MNPKPAFVAKEAVRNLAGFGYLADALQCVFVDRGDSQDPQKIANSKKQVLAKIKAR